MRCEVCGCEIADPISAAVSLESANRLPNLLDALADDYFASYGIPVARPLMRRTAETVGGYVTLCGDCQVRLDVPGAAASGALAGRSAFDRPDADLASGVVPAPVGWCLSNLSSPDPGQRARAVRSLVQTGPAAVPSLLEWLPTCTADRSAGVATLAYLGAVEAAPVLVRVVMEGREEEKEATRAALRAFGRKCLPALEEALGPETATLPEERQHLLEALAHLGDLGVPLICRVLSDPEPSVRRMAFAVLELTPTAACVEPVAEQLDDLDRRVRKGAAALLGRTGSAEAVPVLVELLEDPSTEVRLAAAWALTRLAQPIPWPADSEPPDWKVDGWLCGGLLQLSGRPREEIEALMLGKGVPIDLETIASKDSSGIATQAKELLSAGQAEAAAELLRGAHSDFPFEVAPAAMLAQCQAQMKQWREATETLERVIALDPFTARWHHNLGVARFQLGAKGLAVGQWEQAVLLDPSHAGAKEALSRVKVEGMGPALTVCLAHPSLQAAGLCRTCGVPLCRECAYSSAEGPCCERHVAPVPDESRRQASQLVARGRGAVQRLRRRVNAARTSRTGEEGLLLDVAVYSVLGPTAFQPAGPAQEPGVPVVRALRDALIYDPSCEEAAVRLGELGDLCDAAGYPDIVPADLREWAWEVCARSNPEALFARFIVRSRTDRRAALWSYFRGLARSEPPRWNGDTAQVIEQAIDEGHTLELLPYLRAILPRLRPHSGERRECRTRMRFLESA